MSIVAYNRQYLAADRCQVNCDCRNLGCKIVVADGYAFATTGDAQRFDPLINWFLKDKANPRKWPKFQTEDSWSRLIVAKFNVCFFYESLPYAQNVLEPYYAFGSGRDFALGCLFAGGSSILAVQAANKFCTNCGLGVQYVDLDTMTLYTED